MKIPAFIILLIGSMAWAQAPVPRTSASATPAASTSASNAATSAPDLSDLLQQIRTSAEKSDADVARLRIDRWKTDAASKQQATASAESIRRNLTYAVPDLLQRMQAAPASLNANFRLYRNLNALFDTFSALVESAGAFGAREQFDPLSADLAQLDHVRRLMADRVDLLAGNNDAELARLRSQAALVASGTKQTPAKVVVNNDDQPKTKKKPRPAQTQTQTPAK